jgi:peptidoglycan/xylan/chitin deacetylase (PgdA/CDA1 family)
LRVFTRLLSIFNAVLLLATALLPSLTATASAASANLIANSSVETADSSGKLPQSWSQDAWGTNTHTFSYLTTGHTGSRSVKVQISSYGSGDAKWAAAPVNVQSGTKYDYSDYYQSSITSDVVAQYDDGAGNYTYVDLGTASASASTWKQYAVSLTVPAGVKQVTVFHLIAGVGTLTLDDASLSMSDTTTTPPATGNLVANPSVETASTNNSAIPASWSQDAWGTNTHTFSYLTTGHTGSRSLQVQITKYTSGDAKWSFAPVAVTSGTTYTFSDYYQASVATDVVAQYDDGAGNYTYVDLGTAAKTTAWTQFTTSLTVPAGAKNVTILHVIAAVGTLTTDDFSLVSNTPVSTKPQISLTTPLPNASISGTATLSAAATAQGGNAIKNVQFQVDGANVGTAVAASPYNYALDTTKLTDGTHSVSAVATAVDGQTASATAVTVTVANGTTTSPNLVPNASVETVEPTDTTSPKQWYKGNWGNNTTAFTYATTGHTGSRSVEITMTNFTDGGANWTYDAAAVTPGKQYSFTEYYQSNTFTQALVAVRMSDGTTKYIWLQNPYTSDGVWTKLSAVFTAPAGAVSVVVYHSIAGNGYLMTDDYSLQLYTPKGFAHPIVSVTFDDSIKSQYTNALPVLQKYGMKGTFYVISGQLNNCSPTSGDLCYMSTNDVKALYNGGNEIGSHTITHPDLTTLNSTQLTQELGGSQAALQQLLGGAPVTDFAAPYGNVNSTVLAESQKYYVSQRGVQLGYNSIDNYNQQDLLVQDINSTTTVAQLKSYIDYAKATNTWLILMYHDIDTDTTVDPGYDTTPADFETHMAYLAASGIKVETITQGISDVAPQVK